MKLNPGALTPLRSGRDDVFRGGKERRLQSSELLLCARGSGHLFRFRDIKISDIRNGGKVETTFQGCGRLIQCSQQLPDLSVPSVPASLIRKANTYRKRKAPTVSGAFTPFGKGLRYNRPILRSRAIAPAP